MATSTALPRGWESGPLAEELKTYQTLKADLLRQSPGKFALIKHDQIIGLYDHDEEAYNEGYRRFHRAAFLVKQVQEQDKTYYIGGSALTLLDDEADHAAP